MAEELLEAVEVEAIDEEAPGDSLPNEQPNEGLVSIESADEPAQTNAASSNTEGPQAEEVRCVTRLHGLSARSFNFPLLTGIPTRRRR